MACTGGSGPGCYESAVDNAGRELEGSVHSLGAARARVDLTGSTPHGGSPSAAWAHDVQPLGLDMGSVVSPVARALTPQSFREQTSHTNSQRGVLEQLVRNLISGQTGDVDGAFELWALARASSPPVHHVIPPVSAALLAAEEKPKDWKWKTDFCVADAGYTLCVWHIGPTEYWYSITEHLLYTTLDMNKALTNKVAEAMLLGAAGSAGITKQFPGAAVPAGIIAVLLGLGGLGLKLLDLCCGVRVILPRGGGSGPLPSAIAVPIIDC